MKRRKFITTTTAGLLGLSLPTLANSPDKQNRQSPTLPDRHFQQLFIGTPVLPEYLYEHGIGRCLDEMQEWAGIDTVMTFSHDHVFRQYEKNFAPKKDKKGRPLTSLWVKTNPKYYSDPALQGKTPDTKYAGGDILDDLYAEAKPRKMKVYARILEPYMITGIIPGFEKFAEVDANGQKGRNVCFNHPGYIAYWDSVVEDLVRTHPYLDGFKFGQERGGPLLSSLGKKNVGTCFCEHCLAIAKEQGYNAKRARQGLLAIQAYGLAIKAGEKPVDGNFVTFLRLLSEYPDVLSWERLWMNSREAQRKRIYQKIKEIDRSIQVGWHIDHGMTWDLITRATWDYSTMGPYSDWLSVAVYFDSMGRRSMKHYEHNYNSILFGDADEAYSYPMYLSMLGYDPEKQASLETHRKHDTAFSSDYVYQECRRAVLAVDGAAQVHARPGFDMPGYDCQITPQQVYQAVTKALESGVDGLWCGREWDELKIENIKAFGKAVKDWQKR